MTILILTLLLVVWAVVLGPNLWRRHSVQHSVDSVHRFRRALRALRIVQATVPALVAPAHQLTADRQVGSGWRPISAGGARLRLVTDTDCAGAGGAGPRAGGSQAAGSRASACKRRRDVLVGLVASTLGAALLGALPPLHPLLVVALVAAMLVAGYLVLLVRLRVVDEERQRRHRRLQAAAEQRVGAAAQDPICWPGGAAEEPAARAAAAR